MTGPGKFGKSLALVLMFWCAGIGCMLVCYTTAGGTLLAESASGPSYGMPATPSCHTHRQKNRNTASKRAVSDRVGQLNLPMPTRAAALSCCPLTSGSTAAAYRPESHNFAPALANSESQILNLAHLTTAPVAIPMRLPDRAHSYLLGCTFRI
jgi:hypothetical protein